MGALQSIRQWLFPTEGQDGHSVAKVLAKGPSKEPQVLGKEPIVETTRPQRRIPPDWVNERVELPIRRRRTQPLKEADPVSHTDCMVSHTDCTVSHTTQEPANYVRPQTPAERQARRRTKQDQNERRRLHREYMRGWRAKLKAENAAAEQPGAVVVPLRRV